MLEKYLDEKKLSEVFGLQKASPEERKQTMFLITMLIQSRILEGIMLELDEGKVAGMMALIEKKDEAGLEKFLAQANINLRDLFDQVIKKITQELAD